MGLKEVHHILNDLRCGNPKFLATLSMEISSSDSTEAAAAPNKKHEASVVSWAQLLTAGLSSAPSTSRGAETDALFSMRTTGDGSIGSWDPPSSEERNVYSPCGVACGFSGRIDPVQRRE